MIQYGRVKSLRKGPDSTLRRDNKMAVGDIYDSYLEAAIIGDKINGLLNEENHKKLVDFEILTTALTEEMKIDGPIIAKIANSFITGKAMK